MKDQIELPGYKDVKDFASQHGYAFTTVYRQLKKGSCAWPRLKRNGQVKHPLYKTWEKMKSRCFNPNVAGYKNWGGRGITICGRWLEFENFVEDLGPKPGPTYTMDRIDNEGNYEPGNVRWATPTVQARNTRLAIGGMSQDKRRGNWLVRFHGKYIGSFMDKEKAQQTLDLLRETANGK